MVDLTKELVAASVPKNLKSNVTQDLVDEINALVADPMIREDFKENLLTYTNVLKEGQYTIKDYVNAVHFCTHRLMGSLVGEAYAKTFPDRYMKLVNRGATQKEISSFSTAYKKNKLVNLIMEQSMIPTHILNVDVHQQAINKLASIMGNDDVSFRVQVDAATGLLTHLSAPVVKKVQVDVTTNDDSISELKETTRKLAQQQKALLEAGGMTTVEMAESVLVTKKDPFAGQDIEDGEFTENE